MTTGGLGAADLDLILKAAVAEALAPIKALHAEVPTFEHTDFCPDEDAHDWDTGSDGEPICRTCPRHESVCTTCRDEDGDPFPWPCPTVRAALAGGGDRD